MAKFLIQTMDGEIVFDFAFHLKESVKFNNWFYNEKVHDYMLCEDINKIDLLDIGEVIPIGSVEFVINFYRIHHGIECIRPINIPRELNKFEFLQRRVFLGNEKNDIVSLSDDKYFIKDISGFKKLVDIVPFNKIPGDENFLASEKINILSEWRCFVHNDKLLDVRSYLSDIFIYPDIEKIKEMIGSYTNSPKAYTLDVAITDKGKTVLIEIHQFFSIGLYGFMDYKILPSMFISAHEEILDLKNN